MENYQVGALRSIEHSIVRIAWNAGPRQRRRIPMSDWSMERTVCPVIAASGLCGDGQASLIWSAGSAAPVHRQPSRFCSRTRGYSAMPSFTPHCVGDTAEPVRSNRRFTGQCAVSYRFRRHNTGNGTPSIANRQVCRAIRALNSRGNTRY